jgi:hypothetical protein
VLSLVLLQSRSYGDIASLLRLSEGDVRTRAHAAAGQLVPGEGGPAAEMRAQIIDYMLGEQTVSARAQTRLELESSDVARKWARQLADGLTPLAKSPLPAIPDPPAPPAPAQTPVKPVNPIDSGARAKPETRAKPAARPEPETRAKPTARPKPEAPAKPAEGVSATVPRPISEFTPDFTPSRRLPLRGGVPRGRVLAAASLALIAIIALVIVLATSGGGSKPSTSIPAPPPPTQTGATTHAARTIEKLVLQAAGPNRNAIGAGAVVRQRDGSLLLLVQARGLTPNSQHNAYAVWLVNTTADARLLGFVKPAVGASGTFSSGTTLPSDAFRFHSLVVTIERSSQPTSPGPAVLRSPLSLP